MVVVARFLANFRRNREVGVRNIEYGNGRRRLKRIRRKMIGRVFHWVDQEQRWARMDQEKYAVNQSRKPMSHDKDTAE